MRDKFLQYLASRQYHVAVRSVYYWLMAERGTDSTDSATNLLNSVGCRRFLVDIKPKLSRRHMLNHFLYCWERLKELQISKIIKHSRWDVEICEDENCFDKITKGGYLWLPNTVRIELAAEFWLQKTRVPRVMYFAAIVMLDAEEKFDGRVYLDSLVHRVATKNRKFWNSSL